MDSAFKSVYQSALEDPETFWAQAAEDVHWYRRWDRVLDDSTPPFYRWFPGAQFNRSEERRVGKEVSSRLSPYH